MASSCPRCGYSVPPALAVCPNCGRDLATGAVVKTARGASRTDPSDFIAGMWEGEHGGGHRRLVLPSFIPLQGRAVAGLAGMGLRVCVAVVGIVVAIDRFGVVRDIVSVPTQPTTQSLVELSRQQTRLQEFASLAFVLSILAVLPFLIWFHAAYTNLRASGIQQLPTSPGWATAEWIIPFVNLVRPYQRLNEIWRGSAPDGQVGDPQWRTRPGDTLIYVWWVLVDVAFVVPLVLVLLAGAVTGLDQAKRYLELAYVMTIVGSAMNIAAALIGMATVVRVTERLTIRMRVLRQSVSAAAE